MPSQSHKRTIELVAVASHPFLWRAMFSWETWPCHTTCWWCNLARAHNTTTASGCIRQLPYGVYAMRNIIKCVCSARTHRTHANELQTHSDKNCSSLANDICEKRKKRKTHYNYYFLYLQNFRCPKSWSSALRTTFKLHGHSATASISTR